MKDYKAAYNILMEYWNGTDCIPEEKRAAVNKRLEMVLNNNNNPPPREAISNALKRLRDKYSFGVPD